MGGDYWRVLKWHRRLCGHWGRLLKVANRDLSLGQINKKNSQIGVDQAHLNSQATAPLRTVLMRSRDSCADWCTLSRTVIQGHSFLLFFFVTLSSLLDLSMSWFTPQWCLFRKYVVCGNTVKLMYLQWSRSRIIIIQLVDTTVRKTNKLTNKLFIHLAMAVLSKSEHRTRQERERFFQPSSA